MNKEGKIMGILPFLFLTFITLKLTNLIDWSWVWVCSPLIIIVMLYAIAMAIGIFVTIKYAGKD